MSDFRIIDALCALVETQNAIIKAQNLRLGELGEILMEDEIAEAEKHYQQLIGVGAERGVIPVVQVDIGELLLAILAAMGIPSTIMGLIVWRLKGRIESRETEQNKKAEDQKELFLLMVQSTRASIALGEATARAVQRIPDAHCNGDMRAALDYATNVKHKQKDFLDRQGINALLDE